MRATCNNQTGVWTKKKELQGETYGIEIANLEV